MVCCAANGWAADGALAPDDVAQLLRANRLGLTLQDGKFAGPAAPVLIAAIDAARYVALGEDHLTAEIPQFAAAVCDVMAPHGLAAMAMETGPLVGKLVTPLLRAGGADAALQHLIARYPDSVAFLSMRNESALAAHCARAAAPAALQLWGLDQEFLGSAGWLLDAMGQHTMPAAAAAAVQQLQIQERRDAAAANRSGDPAALFLLAVSAHDLDETAAALRQGSDAATVALFEELAVSHDIYAGHSRGSDSNGARARLLKQNFAHDLQGLRSATPAPRVLLKFGEYHLYKGINPLHQRDLGNFVAELADGQGAASLHIAILGAGGVHRLYNGYNRPTALVPFVLVQDADYAWLKPAIGEMLPAGWTMFDLRRLRFQRTAHFDEDWQRLIYGYDLLVLIPKLTPADPL